MTLLVTASSHSFSWPPWRSPICLENRQPHCGGRRNRREKLQVRSRHGCHLQFPARYMPWPSAGCCSSRLERPAWYRLHERNLISGIRWNVQWPEQAPNFRKLKIDNEIRAVLRFDEGDAAAWTISSPVNATEPKTVPCSLYVFRWNPGKNSALLANLHRPDVCLPASGWKQVADHGVRSYPISDSVELPFRHFEFQRSFEGSHAADGTRVLLFVGRSRFGRLRIPWQHRLAWNVRKSF